MKAFHHRAHSLDEWLTPATRRDADSYPFQALGHSRMWIRFWKQNEKKWNETFIWVSRSKKRSTQARRRMSSHHGLFSRFVKYPTENNNKNFLPLVLGSHWSWYVLWVALDLWLLEKQFEWRMEIVGIEFYARASSERAGFMFMLFLLVFKKYCFLISMHAIPTIVSEPHWQFRLT